MTPQLIVAFIIGGFSLGSAIIAFINLIRPKGDWQKSVDDERLEFNKKEHCKETINIRVRFSISLLCRRLQQFGNITIYLLIGIALATVIAAVFGLMLWFTMTNGSSGAALPPTASSSPDSAYMILTGIFSVILFIAILALAVSFALTTAIDILESGRENP